MRFLARVGGPRAAVVVLTAVAGVYMALVAFNNVTDYGSNHAFVQHVFAMDTTFGAPSAAWRAITSPALVTVAYVLIIAWEALTAVVLLAGLGAWLSGRSRLGSLLSGTGFGMQVLLFGLGFIVIGGEWFLMWQSKQWNGLTAALQNVVIAGFGLVLVHVAGRGEPVLERAAADVERAG